MSKRITNREVPTAVAAGRAFHTGRRSIWSQAGTGTSLHLGKLPQDWRNVLTHDTVTVGVDYVVYSYFTPIAWRRLDGTVVVPDVWYSSNTHSHQGLVRQGLALTTNVVTTLPEGVTA